MSTTTVEDLMVHSNVRTYCGVECDAEGCGTRTMFQKSLGEREADRHVAKLGWSTQRIHGRPRHHCPDCRHVQPDPTK